MVTCFNSCGNHRYNIDSYSLFLDDHEPQIKHFKKKKIIEKHINLKKIKVYFLFKDYNTKILVTFVEPNHEKSMRNLNKPSNIDGQ